MRTDRRLGPPVVAALCTALLVAMSWGYGPHRDELYFVMLGAHPAVAYVDQPALVPLLDHLVATVSGGSLVALRVWPALAMGAVVLVTAALAGELGAGRRGRLAAAVLMASGAITLAVGHLATTSALDLLWWSLVCLLLLRALRLGGRWWLVLGVVAAVAVWTKLLVLLLLVGVAVGLVVGGPRAPLRTPWPYAAALVAAVGAAPVLWWQWAHDLPQLQMASSIAEGGSASSVDRWLLVPYLLVLVSPVAVPVWALGWWRLARDPELRHGRWAAVAAVVVLVLTLVSGGKPYYVAGLFPVLLAAGAEPLAAWLARWRVAVVACLVVNAVLFLPVLPERVLAASPVPAVNPDAGETVGWERFVDTVGAAYDDVPAGERPVVLAQNYGEAGAVHRWRPDIPVHSPHNGLWDLGPPPEGATVVAVGYEPSELARWCDASRVVAEVDNGLDLDNDEQGAQVLVCRPAGSWAQAWPALRRLG